MSVHYLRYALAAMRLKRPGDATNLAQARPRGCSFLWCLQVCDRGDTGQALIESAICLPILFLVVFAIFTFGIAFSNYLVLEDATNVGARQLAISRGQSTDPCSTASTAIIAAAPTLTRANLTFNYTFNGVAASGTTCTSAATNLVQGATAKVTVTYPCTLVSYRWSYTNTCTLTSATAELIQ